MQQPSLGYGQGMGRRREGVGAGLVALALATWACQAGPGARALPRGTKASPQALASAPLASQPGATPLPLEAEGRRLGGGLVQVQLEGEARLLSNHGAGLISNHGGGLLSNHGGGLVSDQGGGLLSNHGAGFRLQAEPGQAPRPEARLAEAQIEFLDAEQRLLLDAQGQPILARTDGTGVFRFEGRLPDEHLVARIRLFQGGQLLAMLPRSLAAGPRRVVLSTASSLGAAVVLGRFVQAAQPGQRQATYNRLPEAEGAALATELEAARGSLGAELPSYRPEELVALAQRLEAQHAPVQQRLARIRALLLAGQAELGEGLPATAVALAFPSGALWRQGELWLSEFLDARVRSVGADGLIRRRPMLWGGLSRASIDRMEAAPDGSLLLVDRAGSRVLRRGAEGQLGVAAGTGLRGQSLGGGQAKAMELDGPRPLAVWPDGSWVLGEDSRRSEVAGRLLRFDGQGQVEALALPPAATSDPPHWHGLAAWPDGRLAALESTQPALYWRDASGAWTVHEGLKPSIGDGDHLGLIALPDGRALLSEESRHRLYLVRQGEPGLVPLAGTGEGGYSGDGGPALQARFNAPRATGLDEQGRLLVVDQGNGLVRRLPLPPALGPVETLAGSFAFSQVGAAMALPINGPGGMTVDAQGRVVVSESLAGVIKVLAGDRLEVRAGGARGYRDGPALEARFNGPSGLALGPDGSLYIADTENRAIRRLGPDGQVRTVVGVSKPGEGGELKGQRGMPAGHLAAPEACALRRPMGVAVSPQGGLYWSDNENHQVWRLREDGQAELVLGLSPQGPAGELPKPVPGLGLSADGLASGCPLNLPSGLSFGPGGALYVCDSGNQRILKVDPPTPQGRVSLFAGVDLVSGLARLRQGDLGAAPEERTQALIIAPASVAWLPDGRALISEAGTEYLRGYLGAVGLPEAMFQAIVPSRIRLVDAQGQVSVLAGPGGRVLDAEGDEGLGGALALAVDPQGRLLIADLLRNQVKLLPAGSF